MNELPTLREGERLGKWRILRQLGAGGFGDVYEVETPAVPNRTRALKLVPDSTQRSREYDVLIRHVVGGHRAIAPFVDVVTPRNGAPENTIGLIMPVGDESLDERIRSRGPLDDPEARTLFLEISSGLHYLHSGKDFPPVVHNDIKPAPYQLNGVTLLPKINWMRIPHNAAQTAAPINPSHVFAAFTVAAIT